jgi:hypothetical protein
MKANFRFLILAFMLILVINQTYAQITDPIHGQTSQVSPIGDKIDGIPEWISGNGKLFVNGANVGIGTNNPARAFHVNGAGHLYMRASSFGGGQFHDFVSAIELRRTLDNNQSLLWDIVNQGTFKIRRNNQTLFIMDQSSSQFGNSLYKQTVNIWGKDLTNESGVVSGGSFVIKSSIGNTTRTLRLDGEHLESENNFYINRYTSNHLLMAEGGGNVSIGLPDTESKLNIRSTDYMQLKLGNNGAGGANWRIGVSNNNWDSGGGKLVFTPTNKSADAALVMTAAGNIGIGLTTPSSLLHVNGRTKTKILEITGGSDLAEGFDISDSEILLPGTVVSIDPENAGKLRISSSQYDKTVAGIISGAGNVNTGMLMGQENSIADGRHPVALTGRVYCRVDAGYGAIKPGDLLTTSDTPGVAMKVSDHENAAGSIIGKAMTSLDEGEGLVLVLVSLQ